MNPLPKLKKSLREKIAVKFLLSQTEEDYCFGVVVRVAPEFVALRAIDDFECNGIVVYRISEVAEFINDGQIRCANRILKANGQLEKLRPPGWLDKCDTMEDVFQQLKKRCILPSIEVKEGNDDWFFIGKITHVEPEGIIVHHYDAHGVWYDPVPVALQYVTRMEFDSRYLKHFGNYMKSKTTSPETKTR